MAGRCCEWSSSNAAQCVQTAAGHVSGTKCGGPWSEHCKVECFHWGIVHSDNFLGELGIVLPAWAVRLSGGTTSSDEATAGVDTWTT